MFVVKGLDHSRERCLSRGYLLEGQGVFRGRVDAEMWA